MTRILMLLLAVLAALLPATVRAEDPPPPQPTVRIFQEMIGAVADSLFLAPGLARPATVRITIEPATHAWYLETSVHASAQAHELTPTEAAAARYEARIGVEQIGTVYEDARRTWVFGEQIMDRTVRLAGTLKLVEKGTGAILISRPFDSLVRDTVAVVGCESLESPGIPPTHAVAPVSGAFSSLVEPVVLIGSVAVAVYLLFSVRN